MLAYLTRDSGEPSLLAFFGLVTVTSVPVFVLYFRLSQQDIQPHLVRLILWAIVFRFAGLMGGPFYEDDFHRYLWDGFLFWNAGSPYGVAPEAFFLDQSIPVALQEALNQINHPELTTIYGPVTQTLFLFSFQISAGNVLVIQALLIAVDLLVVILLTQLTHNRNVMLYAWCPLIIKEIAFTAHPDVLGSCLLLAAIVLCQKKHAYWAAVCLGLAVGAKVFAVLIAPFMLIHCRPKCWIVFAMTVVLVYLPFLATGDAGLGSLITFAKEWEFNSALYGLLTNLLSAIPAKIVLGTLFGVVWLWLLHNHYRKSETVPRGDWVFGLFFLVSPVINPWYAIWLLPFAAIFPSRWAWTASVALTLAYITGLNLSNLEVQAYAQPWFVRVIEFSAIAIALSWDVWRHRVKRQDSEISTSVQPIDDRRSNSST